MNHNWVQYLAFAGAICEQLFVQNEVYRMGSPREYVAVSRMSWCASLAQSLHCQVAPCHIVYLRMCRKLRNGVSCRTSSSQSFRSWYYAVRWNVLARISVTVPLQPCVQSSYLPFTCSFWVSCEVESRNGVTVPSLPSLTLPCCSAWAAHEDRWLWSEVSWRASASQSFTARSSLVMLSMHVQTMEIENC